MKRFLGLVLAICLGIPVFGQLPGGSTTSPYSRKAGPYIITGGIGLGLSVGATLGQGRVAPLTTDERNALDPDNLLLMDRVATRHWRPGVAKLSDGFLIGSLLLPLPLLLGKGPRADIGPLILMGEETLLITYGLTTLTKWLVRRARPFNYQTAGPDLPGLAEAQMGRDARFSFFSGHTSTVAAMSFFTAQVFSDYYHRDQKPVASALVWGGAVVIPAAVGLMRVRAGKHFPTDVIVGYLVGAAVGMLIPRLHHRN